MKLRTGGVRGELLELRIDGCTFKCPVEKYETLVKKMLPTNEDKWCLSNQCRKERLKIKWSQHGRPTI